MSDAGHDPFRSPGARNYSFLCLVALLALALVLFERGLGVWGLFPAAVGGLGLVLRWRAGPVFVLLALGGVLFAHELGHTPFSLLQQILVAMVEPLYGRWGRRRLTMPLWRPPQASVVSDLALAAAAMAYLVGHYRWLALVRHVFPPDARRGFAALAQARQPRRGRPVVPPPAQRRSPHLATPREMLLWLVTLPAWVCLASVLHEWLTNSQPRLHLNDTVWYLIVVVWLIGVTGFVLAAVVGYLGQRRRPAVEATMFLQDTLWRETRREQSRLNRWLAWAGKRRREDTA